MFRRAGREMVWPIRKYNFKPLMLRHSFVKALKLNCPLSISVPKARWVVPTMAALSLRPFSGLSKSHLGLHQTSSFSNQANLAQVEETHEGLLPPETKRQAVSSVEASSDVSEANNVLNFREMKERFLSFKKHKFLKESEHFNNLAQTQDPKFLVIACADSRVCPSNILGFQPGDAFMIRNIANLVPPFENGASETNAALEFAVNNLEVENIFVIGHSSCAGIETLMRMPDGGESSFSHSWVGNANVAKLRTKAAASHLSFDQQCRHCEKESIGHSLLNLLTYPWIDDRVKNELLSIHGGYYDFLNCTFDKWTLDVNSSKSNLGDKHYMFKDREHWC